MKYNKILSMFIFGFILCINVVNGQVDDGNFKSKISKGNSKTFNAKFPVSAATLGKNFRASIAASLSRCTCSGDVLNFLYSSDCFFK